MLSIIVLNTFIAFRNALNTFIAFRNALNIVIAFIYIYYVVNIVHFSPSFVCDLGVKISIGRGGLCKTSMGALTTT